MPGRWQSWTNLIEDAPSQDPKLQSILGKIIVSSESSQSRTGYR